VKETCCHICHRYQPAAKIDGTRCVDRAACLREAFRTPPVHVPRRVLREQFGAPPIK